MFWLINIKVFYTFVGESGVKPAAEKVLLIPLTLTMANHNNLIFSSHFCTNSCQLQPANVDCLTSDSTDLYFDKVIEDNSIDDYSRPYQ